MQLILRYCIVYKIDYIDKTMPTKIFLSATKSISAVVSSKPELKLGGFTNKASDLLVTKNPSAFRSNNVVLDLDNIGEKTQDIILT